MPNLVDVDDILPPLSTEDKMLAGLCYPFWMCIPFFVLASSKREDPFLLFHSMQGLALGLLSSLVSILGVLFLWITFSSLPTSWMMTSGLVGVVLVLAALGFGALCFGMSIFFGWQASSGKFLRAIGVGDLCEAKMASMLNLSAAQLRALAVDRELVPDEKVVVLQAVSTPEQMQAEMDRWAQPAATAESWWGAKAAPEQVRPAVQQPMDTPVRQPAQPVRPAAQTQPQQRPVQPEVRAWKPASANPTPAPAPPEKGEVKPWRPQPAQPTPQAKPVSFPSVSREPEPEKKKWWAPKEA